MDVYNATELAYKRGYKKGLDDAVKMGLAHDTHSDKRLFDDYSYEDAVNDTLKMLLLIHTENMSILKIHAINSRVEEKINNLVDEFEKILDTQMKFNEYINKKNGN